MATSREFVPWRDIEPERSDTWITTEEFEKLVEQAKAMQVEARADREFYENDTYWLGQTEPERNYSGERG